LRGQLREEETADCLHALIRRLIRAGQTRVILNMRHLGTIDLAALSALLVDLLRVRQNGGDLGLLYVQPANMDLLVRSQTNTAFRIFASLGEAVQAFCGTSPVKLALPPRDQRASVEPAA